MVSLCGGILIWRFFEQTLESKASEIDAGAAMVHEFNLAIEYLDEEARKKCLEEIDAKSIKYLTFIHNRLPEEEQVEPSILNLIDLTRGPSVLLYELKGFGRFLGHVKRFFTYGSRLSDDLQALRARQDFFDNLRIHVDKDTPKAEIHRMLAIQCEVLEKFIEGDQFTFQILANTRRQDQQEYALEVIMRFLTAKKSLVERVQIQKWEIAFFSWLIFVTGTLGFFGTMTLIIAQYSGILLFTGLSFVFATWGFLTLLYDI